MRSADQGGLYYEKVFTVSVTNVNEAPTDISLSPSSVAENAVVNTIVGALSTTDPDSGNTFTYSLVSGTGSTDNASFNLSGVNLRTSTVFDYEAKSSYSIRVRSTDQGGLYYEKVITVSVTNVNETPTDISLSSANVAENAVANTLVGVLSTTDPDSGSSFTYTLVSGTGSSDNGVFNISNTKLLTSASFNYETKSSYSIRVRSTDQGGLYYEKVITVSVTDVNETPSNIIIDNASVAENAAVNTVVGALSTTDPDSGNTFTYTLVSGTGSTDNASFNISGANLRTSAVFDYKTQSSYTIRVRSTDQGGLYYEKVFPIIIIDSTKKTPNVTWPTASSITFGQKLADSTLNGGSAEDKNGDPLPGVFTFTTPADIPGAGTAPQYVTFTPDDSSYTPVTSTISVNVVVFAESANVTVWPTANSITYGQTLNESSLSGGSASTPGSFAFTTPSTMPNAGTDYQSVTFTPYDSNYNSVTDTTHVTVIVDKAGQSITFTSTAPTGAVVGGTIYTPAVTGGSSGIGVVFTIDNSASSVCSISGGNVSFLTVGTCKINANQSGNSNFYAAPQAQQSLTVDMGDQTINFTSTAPSNAVVGGSAYTPAATGGASGIAVVFTIDSTTTSTCSISGGNVSFQTIGTCLVNSNQAGNANYNAAVQVQQSFLVGRANPNVTVWPTASAISYGQTLADSNLSSGSASVAGSFVFTTPSTIPNAGAALQNVTFIPDDSSNYNPVTGTVSVTVAMVTPVITFDAAPTPTYLDNFSVNATTSNSDSSTLTYSRVSGPCAWISGSTFSTTGAGTCVVQADGGATTNFYAASQTQNITISPANTTTSITADSSDPTVTGQSYPISVLVAAAAPGHGTPDGTVLVDDSAQSCTVTLSGGIGSCPLTSTTAGSKTITATYGGSANFSPSSISSETHTVNKANTTTTITADAPDPSEIGNLYPVSVNVAAVLPGSGTPSGSVAIVNSGSSCTVTLTAGSGSCNLSSDVIGARNITATYAGDGNFSSSSDTESHQVVNLTPTITITDITAIKSVTGEPYQVSFRVAHLPGIPTGNVVVSDGSGTPAGSCTSILDSAGLGACGLTSSTPGNKTITVSYLGDSIFEPVVTTSSHQVDKADTTTTINSDTPDPSDYGSNYTVTVSVAAVAPGSGTPTDSVSVSDGTNTCSVTLASASGSCSLPSDGIASRTLTATFAGDSNFHGSTSPTASHTIQKATPTVTITDSSANPSVTGQTYTVSFSVTHTAGTPTGSVTVSDGTSATCSGTLNAGLGSCDLTSTSAGSKTLTANYGGDGSFSSASGTAPQAVNQDATSTTIKSDSPDPSLTGQPYTVSVDVTAVAPGSGTPTGSVIVNDGESNTCTITLSAGSGSCSLATFTVGTKTISTVYQGDSDFLTSTKTAVHSVAIADTSTSISGDSPNPSAPGETVTFSTVVTPVSPAAGVPTGVVDIKEASTVLCSATLSGGTASCTYSGLPGGSHTLRAVYNGSTDFKPSTSTDKTHIVEPITLDDNKTSTSFTGVGHFYTSAGLAPFTYTLETSGRTCTGANGAGNSGFSISSNTLQRNPATPAGTYSICVQSVDASAGVVQAVFSVIINNPPSLLGTALDHTTVSVDQTDVGHLTSSGGQDPQAFNLESSGKVCDSTNSSGNAFFSIAGTTLKRNSGTPSGTYLICFQVKDAESETAQQAVSITVTAPPAAMTLSKNTVSTAQTNVGDFSLNNGQSPFTYTLETSGKVCDGINGGNNGHFSIGGNTLQLHPGTTAGLYSICVQAEDANFLTTQQVFSVTVTEPPSDITLSNTTVTTAQSIVGTMNTVKGQFTFTYTLQNSGITCDLTNGADNIKFQVNGNALERLMTTLAGTYHICLQTEDANSEIFQKSFDLLVSEGSAPSPAAWTTSLTSDKVIDGDKPGIPVGTAISSVSGTTFQLVDSTTFPFESAFNLTPSGLLTLATSVDINVQKYYPIRILATTPDGRTQTIDAVITVMKNGKTTGAAATEDVGHLGENGEIEVDVLSNDILSPGATTWETLQIVRYPEHGTARIGSIIYTPSRNFIGSDIITYRACDNLGFCVVGELTLSVAPNGGGIPETGFTPNRLTTLPAQPADKLYTETNEMSLNIPSLGVQAPVVGVPSTSTGWDLTWLGKDAGWLQGSAYPTWNGNSVLTGHVYNADGTPGIFVNLSKMHWGDKITVKLQGQSYVYEVRQVLENVRPSDIDALMVHKENPWLTLVTCQGYDLVSDTYRWRIMVRAVLVKVE